MGKQYLDGIARSHCIVETAAGLDSGRTFGIGCSFPAQTINELDRTLS